MRMTTPKKKFCSLKLSAPHFLHKSLPKTISSSPWFTSRRNFHLSKFASVKSSRRRSRKRSEILGSYKKNASRRTPCGNRFCAVSEATCDRSLPSTCRPTKFIGVRLKWTKMSRQVASRLWKSLKCQITSRL